MTIAQIMSNRLDCEGVVVSIRVGRLWCLGLRMVKSRVGCRGLIEDASTVPRRGRMCWYLKARIADQGRPYGSIQVVEDVIEEEAGTPEGMISNLN